MAKKSKMSKKYYEDGVILIEVVVKIVHTLFLKIILSTYSRLPKGNFIFAILV